jgi:hypothetical protein
MEGSRSAGPALDLPEILGAVLGSLPLCCLRVAAAVCRRWHALCKGSLAEHRAALPVRIMFETHGHWSSVFPLGTLQTFLGYSVCCEHNRVAACEISRRQPCYGGPVTYCGLRPGFLAPSAWQQQTEGRIREYYAHSEAWRRRKRCWRFKDGSLVWLGPGVR